MIDANEELIVIDVREESEYCDDEHIPRALNYPWNTGVLQQYYNEIPNDGDILVVCRSGVRSAQASNFLCNQQRFELTPIYNMTGGMLVWQDQGWETVGCCYSAEECDDGLFCNGEENCEALNCQPGNPPCDPFYCCDEGSDACIDHHGDFDCDGLADDGDGSGIPGDNTCTGGEIEDCDDNCPELPNATGFGTCVGIFSGIVSSTGVICTSDTHCGDGEICDKEQGDFNDNGIGDVCECYADFDGDGKVYPGDAMILLGEWKRKDCSGEDPCQADIDGDGKVYPSDAMVFLGEWKRKNCPVLP